MVVRLRWWWPWDRVLGSREYRSQSRKAFMVAADSEVGL